jgi:hypothetical protein
MNEEDFILNPNLYLTSFYNLIRIEFSFCFDILSTFYKTKFTRLHSLYKTLFDYPDSGFKVIIQKKTLKSSIKSMLLDIEPIFDKLQVVLTNLSLSLIVKQKFLILLQFFPIKIVFTLVFFLYRFKYQVTLDNIPFN